MFPWADSSEKMSSCPNGTGYGGQPNDCQKLAAGRKRALAREHKHDAKIIKYFSGQLQKLQSNKNMWISSLDDAGKTKLIDSLRTTFRNQAPTEWESRSELYQGALHLCREFCTDVRLGLLFGKPEDPESLLFSLRDFAEIADMITKRAVHDNHTGPDTALATQIMKVHRLAEKMAKRAKKNTDNNGENSDSGDDLFVMSEQELYTRDLGPLRFDIVNTLQKHAFAHTRILGAGLDARKIFKELTAYKTALPVEHGGSIFVRSVNERLDLIRALIIGPEGTPYANGCFVFDIQLPNKYPTVPPKVQFMTTGGGRVRFNPNLYQCGKVCLSLLGTWSGPGWISGESTLLQVLISIQSLILVPDPYFNEPGYEVHRTKVAGQRKNEEYNKAIRAFTLSLCIERFLSDALSSSTVYPEFHQVIVQHFLLKSRIIKKQVREWAEKDESHAVAKQKICDLLISLKELEKKKSAEHQQRAKNQVIELDGVSKPINSSTNEAIVIDDVVNNDSGVGPKASIFCQHEVIELGDDDEGAINIDTIKEGDKQAHKRSKVANKEENNVVDLT